MATVKKQAQIGLEEEVIEDDEISKKLEEWDSAEEEYQAAEVGRLKKARDDAKAAVVTLLPSLSDKARNFRIGEHTITVTPPGDPSSHTRTPKHRVTIKRVVG